MTTEVANPAVPKINVSERAAKKIIAPCQGWCPPNKAACASACRRRLFRLAYAVRLDTHCVTATKSLKSSAPASSSIEKSSVLNGTTLDYERH